MNIENEGGEEGRLLERGQKASDSEGKRKESYEIWEKIKQKIGKSKDKAEKKNKPKTSSKGENNETIQSKVKSAIFGEETH